MRYSPKFLLMCTPLILGIGHTAFAAGSWSDDTQQTAQLVVSAAAAPLSITVDQVDLTEGTFETGKVLATWRVTSTTGAAKQIGISLPIGSYESCSSSTGGSTCDTAIYAGEHSATNQLSFKLVPDQATTVQGSGFAKKITSNGTLTDFTGTLVSPSAQAVAADTYTIAFEAAVWNP